MTTNPDGAWQELVVASNIRIVFQPYVTASDRTLAGYEALVRLSPFAGAAKADWMEPDAFVPGLEAAGLGGHLTNLVFSHALAVAKPLMDGSAEIAINVPLDVLLDAGFSQTLGGMLRETGTPPGRLVLELTESQPASDTAALRYALAQLRAAGVRVAIDDAGPAVPYCRTLITLGFSALKLDRGLLSAALPGAPGHDDLRSLIAHAHAHALSVVSEGIEDQQTADRMRDLGADILQGYWIAPPLPLAEAIAWREARSTGGTPSGPSAPP